MVKHYVKKYWPTLLGGVIGALGGFLYWKWVGCTSGTCPITASPISSTIWGSILIGLVFNMFQKEEK